MRPRLFGAASIASLIVLSVMLAGCDNKPSGEPPAPGAPPPASPAPVATAPAQAPVTAPAAPATPASQIPLGTAHAVYAVDSLVVTRPDDAPKVVMIKAVGSVRTGGWTDPKLEEMPDAEGGDPSVKSYRFVATSPTADATIQALQSVEADLRVESLPTKVQTIRVISETNEISAFVP